MRYRCSTDINKDTGVIGSSTVVVRYHITKNGSTSLVHRLDYGITSVPVRYTIEATGEPPIHSGALPVLYRCSTDINEAIPEYCRCSSFARSGSASAENFKHIFRRLPLLILSPMFCRCPADVLPMCYYSYRCDTVARPYQYRSPKIYKFVLRYCSSEPDQLGVTLLTLKCIISLFD